MVKRILVFFICFLGISMHAQTTLLDEDFSGGSLPSGWTNTDNGGSPSGSVWEFNDPGARNITAGNFDGNYAILDSDNYGSGNNQDATLETSSFSVGAYETITLEYDYQYRDYVSPESCTVEVFNGTIWTTVASYTTDSGDNYSGATNVSLDITAEVGDASNAKVRFTYTGDWDWWWALDNIKVTGTSPSSVNTYLGPGGVGNTDGTSDLRFWYDANNESYSNGASVNSVADRSGYGNTLSAAGSEQPSYVSTTGAANDMATFSFDGNDELETTYNGNSNENMSFFMVLNYTSASELDIAIQHGGRNTLGFNTSDQYTDYVGGSNHTSTSTATGNWEIHSKTFADSGTDRLNYFVNNSNTDSFTHTIENRTSNTWIGGNGTGGGTAFTGGIAEVIKFTKTVVSVERIIVDNYLSAKYGLTLTTNDFYDQDDVVNGDFDHNVAGIGRASDGSLHIDSQGTGIVRINTPSDLNNDEFLFWGEDVLNANYDFSSSVSTDYIERLDTKWRVSKRNDLGTVSVSFNASDLTLNSPDGCNDLKLIVSSSSTFATKTTYDLVLSSGVYTATGVSFSDNDYFTIEYVDLIVVDGTQFYNGSGFEDVPSTSDDCYKLLVKSSADGSLTLTENGDVREVEVESGGKLVVDSGFRLQVTDGISNSGDIRMIGTSQLIQTHTGTSLNTGSGNMYIDQQGTNTSKFRYNYWSSPVSSGSGSYTVDGVLKDGTTVTSASSNPPDITFTSGYDGDHTTSPITISNFWLYKHTNSWTQFGESGSLSVGEGYAMKGPGAAQNYTFKGTPNDGDFGIDVSNGDVLLVGNPYPSALDADAFITYNSLTNSFIDGSIYFWEHNGEVSTSGDEGHYQTNYQGGYAVRNIGGGVAAVAPSGIGGLGGSSGDIPGQYIAIGQGFFVNAEETGIPVSSEIVFNNSMRGFQVEDGTNSIFFKGKPSKKTETSEELPSFRLGFEQTNSNGIPLTRQLLAVFRDDLTENYDNGYDSGIFDIQDNDAYWNFSSQDDTTGAYVIAGVSYDIDMELPLEVVIGDQGIVSFKELEKTGFNDRVYLYDSLEDIYYGLSRVVSLALAPGRYSDRFYVTFREARNLATNEIDASDEMLLYVNSDKQLYVNTNTSAQIEKVEVYNTLGELQVAYQSEETVVKAHFINIKNLLPSVYVVRVQTNQGTVSKKIMVQ